jgi:hypothetical protein
MRVIQLSATQQSALECRVGGLDPFTAAAWNGAGLLIVTPDTRDALWAELNDASNAEDAASYEETDAAMRTYAGRAARALANLSSRVLRAFPEEN